MNGEQPKPKRTWLWVVLGILLLFVIIAAGGLFFAISFFRQNMNVTPMAATAADQEFESVRARFAGRQPLFQLVDGRAEMVRDPSTGSSASSATPDAVHVLAWDEDDENLVKFTIPFWLLRLKSGPIRISQHMAGFDDRGISFSVEDLERHGRGLLLDLPDQTDGRLLIWAE
jgi:hypothetical protein